MEIKKVLLIGYGSIAKRYHEIFKNKQWKVYAVTHRSDLDIIVYKEIRDALFAQHYDLVLIANDTSKHQESLDELLKNSYDGKILIEKPLFNLYKDNLIDEYKAICSKIYVGYNLRFHPVISFIKEKIAEYKIYSAQLSVGQYLPTWRASNYKQSYSGIKSRGGGVLRDLSHELDLALFLFGDVSCVFSNIRKNSDLEIDVEDTVDIVSKHSHCSSVSIHLDYTNINAKRTISIQGKELSIEGDLVNNFVIVNGEKKVFNSVRNGQYEKEILEVMSDKNCNVATFYDGIKVLEYIRKVESNSFRS